MNKKGFLLAETIMGLFLLGVIAVSCLPILNTAIDNMRIAKHKMEMLFIAESTIEQIKAFDYSWTDEEHIFDMSLKVLIDTLHDSDAIAVRLPLDNKSEEYKYFCTIYKKNNSISLWELEIEVAPYKDNKKIKSIEILTFIPVPIVDGE
ncbi:hypothetical protein [Clostridium sp. Cult2]|uniref:hypothetical protein n=1 Tax=Clostridium sp. Cult2 TaxID=2079003 RepID=UPI001F2D95AA|nr:hypothetical protein [Clostridium sp. Cult2]MCF6465631.1 hypothetical protein [Clostridium sp. Cult2]